MQTQETQTHKCNVYANLLKLLDIYKSKTKGVHAMELNQLAKHTKSCNAESGPAIELAFVTSNDSGISSVSIHKNVSLVTWDYHIFLINSLFHIDTCLIIPIVWSKVDSINDGGEVSSSISSHSQHHAMEINSLQHLSPTIVLKTGPDQPVRPGTGLKSDPVMIKNRK